MKWVIASPTTSKELPKRWIGRDFILQYVEKVRPMFALEMVWLKGAAAEREQGHAKRDADTATFANYLTTDDFVIALDEFGKEVTTEGFVKIVAGGMLSSKKRIVFVVGGPNGFNSKAIGAHHTVKLSSLVMNQPLALMVLLEQIYRTATILKGIPYHNE